MNKQELNDLIDKVNQGMATKEELSLYAFYLKQITSGSEEWDTIKLGTEQQVKAELLSRIETDLGWRAVKQTKLWPKIAAVAAAVTLIALCIYFFSAPRHPDTDRHPELVSGSTDIAPGKNTATLTLANGKIITLSYAKSGVVINGENKMAYNDGSKIDDPALTGRHSEPIVRSMMMMASTPRGGTYQITLPDGTQVWLNADSKISFPSQFYGKERKIILTGEAYFVVVHNAKQPFRVESQTSDGKRQIVEDIGTEFNISAYSDESTVKTTLVVGSARVNATVLNPNQQAMLFANNRITVKEVDVEEAVSWKDGKFFFAEEDIRSVMKKVARWYNITVVYEGTVNDMTFSGSISRFDKLSALLSFMESTHEVKFKIDGHQVTVLPYRK